MQPENVPWYLNKAGVLYCDISRINPDRRGLNPDARELLFRDMGFGEPLLNGARLEERIIFMQETNDRINQAFQQKIMERGYAAQQKPACEYKSQLFGDDFF
ncbi:hypothetical protein HYX01_00965 [Candidatus Woesearchaeota archaeon]|nr:hypothetical protein [Candidatus Woesearchaeota archaeon]